MFWLLKKIDPLRIILNDLGTPIELDEEDTTDIHLTLLNRFKLDVKEPEEKERLYVKTKELVIPILKAVPIIKTLETQYLMDVLKNGQKYAKEANDKLLLENITIVIDNIKKLE